MEDGPAAISGQVEFCLPIAEQKESISVGMHLLLAHAAAGKGVLFPIRFLSMALAMLILPFRVFAIRTSKIPRWPRAVEEQCPLADRDPYAIAGADNGERRQIFPEAAHAANVRFTGPPRSPFD
jgi:hypothetical protein